VTRDGLLRIGMFCTSQPQPGRKPGGVDVSVDRLAGALAERGHHVSLLSYSAPVGERPYQRVQLRPHELHRRAGGRRFLVPLALNRVRTDGLDVLHLHGDDWLYFRRRLPTVRTFHGSALYELLHATNVLRRASQLFYFGCEHISARLATASYTVSPGDMALYGAAGTLDHGIDVPPHKPAPREGPPSILFVGTWEGRKRGRFLAELFAREVRPHVPTAELWMASDRCEEGDGIRWLASPSEDELKSLYERAWAFCLPSTYEGFGIPYLEAMAFGAAVVASPNPGAVYLLSDAEAGLIAQDEALGATLVSVLTDERRRLSLATAGFERAQAFAWERVIERYEDAYRSAITSWSAGRSGRR
jgi:phosphatidyl-myo-inositol alpha-mannosyltransferase